MNLRHFAHQPEFAVAAYPRHMDYSPAPNAGTLEHARTAGRTLRRGADLLRVVRDTSQSLPPHGAAFNERAYALHYTARQVAKSQGIRIEAHGQMVPERCVLVANHLSYVDPLAITRLFPALAIAKAEVAEWPVIGGVMGRLGVLFVQRQCAHSGARVLKAALRALRSGTRVLTFPKGTTSDGSKLLPFKLGAFALARLAGVPVVPIAVRLPKPVCWHGDAAFLPHYLRSIARHDVPVELEVGRALHPAPGLSDEELAALIRADLSAMLKRDDQ
ncbi:MAG: 1-acyl-sn-glycerol-3-phosphate acyltransferase [Polyangiaceae bacterium]|nr:1-acyl-sn-glycerol-3-phosphate acyltransferase [Polyangiaceae bacterium]MCB9609109.1 1-acyl-sn-glycerol-3-phosphate acyltransferase [Polyangiaceae bacterium]